MFRYFFGSSESPNGENCLLSSLDARNLDTVSDIILDSNWDVYRQQCRDDNGGCNKLFLVFSVFFIVFRIIIFYHFSRWGWRRNHRWWGWKRMCPPDTRSVFESFSKVLFLDATNIKIISVAKLFFVTVFLHF